MAEHDDELASLARAAAAADESAFRALVERTTPVVYALARSMLRDDAEAQDVVQETAIRVWQKLPSLRDHGAILGWTCRIARNLCTDRGRKKTRRATDALAPDEIDRVAEQAAGVLAAASAGQPDELAATAQTRRLLHALIDELKPRYRTVFLMHVVEDMTASEIAVALGCAVGTVESQLTRGRRQLAAKLERRGLIDGGHNGGHP